MGHRYYGIKALVLAVAVGLAFASSNLGAPQLGRTTIEVHYGAAAAVQSAALRTTAKFSRAVRDLVRQAECSIAHTI